MDIKYYLGNTCIELVTMFHTIMHIAKSQLALCLVALLFPPILDS